MSRLLIKWYLTLEWINHIMSAICNCTYTCTEFVLSRGCRTVGYARHLKSKLVTRFRMFTQPDCITFQEYNGCWHNYLPKDLCVGLFLPCAFGETILALYKLQSKPATNEMSRFFTILLTPLCCCAVLLRQVCSSDIKHFGELNIKWQGGDKGCTTIKD